MADEKNIVTDEAYAASVFEDGGHLTIDLQDIKEASFEALPKGTYDAEVDSCEFGFSKNSEAPMFTMQFVVTSGDYAGRKLYNYLSFSQKALPYTKQTLKRLAPELLEGKFVPQAIADEGRLLGRACRIRVTTEDFQGEPRNRIAQILAAGSGGGSAGGNFFG